MARFAGSPVAWCALALVAANASIGSAQGQAQSSMRIGAAVAPRCSIAIEENTISIDRSPTVRVICSRAGLRSLRVTTSRGDDLQPTTTFAGAQLQAGGELVFVVPVVLATVASNLPVLSVPAPPDRRPVTVTLDF